MHGDIRDRLQKPMDHYAVFLIMVRSNPLSEIVLLLQRLSTFFVFIAMEFNVMRRYELLAI
jgi:hypothetical protein